MRFSSQLLCCRVLLLGLLSIAGAISTSGQSANDGFAPNVDGRVDAIAIQADGKIILGGEFTAVNGSIRSNIARVTVDGSLDVAFNPGIECPGCYKTVSALAVQPDGRILVGGRFTVLGGMARTNLGRLNADGSIDLSFAGVVDGHVLELALLDDGKILVGGAFFTVGGQPRAGIARLNAVGSLDESFNAQANEAVSSLAVQPDGRILVAGDFTMLGGQPRIGMGRLNADGSLDKSFTPAAIAEVMDVVALQPDGKVLIGGDVTMMVEPPTCIARLNADGSLDTNFNPGMVGEIVHTLVVQPDGKILVGGFFSMLDGQTRTNIGRLNPDGSLDASFSPEINSLASAFVVQPDGKILVGGWFTTLGGTNRNHIGRLYPDGRLDATLNPVATLNNPQEMAEVDAVAVQPDGKIVVGGYFNNLGGQPHNWIGRLNPDGSYDSSFTATAGGGNPTFPVGVTALTVQSDGRLLVGGNFTLLSGLPRTNLARLNVDGSVDTPFDPALAGLVVNCLNVQPDGKILVGGLFNLVGGQVRSNIARLNSDGSLDNAFSPRANRQVLSIALQPDGKIVVAGDFNALAGQPRNRLGRLNPDGSLDTGFAPIPSRLGSPSAASVLIAAVQADGKILIGGNFTEVDHQVRLNVARLNNDGSLDDAFNPGADNIVGALTLQADGKILVGGLFATLGEQPRSHIGRLHFEAGAVDATFNPGANHAAAFAVQADGKILLMGLFDMLSGQSRLRIGRLTGGMTALQRLEVNALGTSVTWTRSGTGPEVEQVRFEQSTDGTNYVALGSGIRINGGWELAGLSFPSGRNFYLRARGRVLGGEHNGSSGLIESVAQFYRIPSPQLFGATVLSNGAFQVTFTNTGLHSYSALATTNLSLPLSNWTILDSPTNIGGGIYQFNDPDAANFPQRFYQLRWP